MCYLLRNNNNNVTNVLLGTGNTQAGNKHADVFESQRHTE